jgi:hypothetical protein
MISKAVISEERLSGRPACRLKSIIEVLVNEGVPQTVETVEQCEEQIRAIACTYQAGALVRRTESWKLSSEFRLEAITGVTAQHSRGLDAPVQQRRRDHGGRGGECRLLSVQDRLAIICNFLMGNNAGERDVGGCLDSPVAA